MELVEELLNQYEMIEDSQILLQELEDYFERAYDETYYEEVLIQLAHRLGQRGYRHHQYAILLALWEILEQSDLARRLVLLSYQNRELDLALAWLKQIDEVNDDQELVMMQAEILYEMGDLDQAHQLFRRLVKENPQLASAYVYLGYIMEQKGELSKAKEYWQVLLTYFPHHARAGEIRRQVLSLYAQEELLQIEDIDKILNLPDLPPIENAEDFLLLARLKTLMGREKEAFADLEKSLELDHQNVEAHLLLVELGAILDDPEKIRLGLEGANKLIPDYDEAIIDLTFLAGQVGHISYDIVEKAQAYLPLVSDIDQIEEMLNILTAYYVKVNHPEGLLSLIESIEDQVEDEVLIYPYAQYYRLIQSYKEAIHYLLDGIELGLNHEEMVADLAMIYMETGQILEAIDLVQNHQTGIYSSPLLETIREELKSFVD